MGLSSHRARRTLPIVQVIAALSLFLFPSASSEAQSVRTWVASNGSDTNPCSRPAPCRTFTAALAAVLAGGEVVVLDSGGYGPTTITKSVAMIAPEGVHAGISPTSGTAITINAGANDSISIRNITLASHGAQDAIVSQAAGSLHVDGVSVESFSGGISFNHSGQLLVTHSVFRDISGGGRRSGVFVGSTTGSATAVIDDCHFLRNNFAVTAAERSYVTIRSSVAEGRGKTSGEAYCGYVGLPATGSVAYLMVESSLVTNYYLGISAAPINYGGIAHVRVSDCTIVNTDRPTGAFTGTDGPSAIYTFGNNRIRDNVNSPSFSGTYTTQ